MPHWYDIATTTFNPEGRLKQVEYAIQTVGLAGTCIGIVAKDGILLAAERRKTDKLLDETIFLEKLFKLNDDVACAVAGVIGDANVLLNEARTAAQRHFKRYRESIPCEQLVSIMCDIKQAYTQFGGKRPFGVSILYMGWDRHYGYQLYRSDPCGNYSGWKAVSVGKNSEPVMSVLNKEYKEGEMTIKDAQALAINCLCRSLNVKKLPPEKVEMALLTRKFNTTDIHILNTSEIGKVMQELKNPQCHESERK